MKTIISLAFCLFATLYVNGQILDRLGKKIENKVKQRVDRKTDKTINQGLDKAENAIDANTKRKKEQTTVVPVPRRVLILRVHLTL